MRFIEQQYAQLPIGDIRPHPRNPRAGDIHAIGQSIGSNGWYGTVVVQASTGYILAGNHRYLAAVKQGATHLPAVLLDVNDEDAIRILLVDNRSNDLASYDDGLLAELLSEIAEQPTGLGVTGFSDDDLARLLADTQPSVEPDESHDQTDELVERFEIVVSCDSDDQQRQLLEQLTKEGYRCRSLVC